MSWIRREARLSTSQENQFKYNPSESLVYSISKGLLAFSPPDNEKGNTSNPSRRTVCTTAQWNQFLEDYSSKEPTPNESRANLILAGRGSRLSKLPWTRETFSKIAEHWSVHSSIARVVNRNKSCHFGRIQYDWGNAIKPVKSLVYNCRTVDTWDNDMGLSVTWFPSTLTANAVWYGCALEKSLFHGWEMSDADRITGRLQNFDGEVFHPMMLPTLFAEFERERLVTLSRRSSKELVRRLESLSNPDFAINRLADKDSAAIDAKPEAPPTIVASILRLLRQKLDCSCEKGKARDDSVETTSTASAELDNIEDQSTVLVWLHLSELRHGLQSWQAQIVKMIEHMEELENLNYCLDDENSEDTELKLSALRDSGGRILGRLHELLFECDEAARNCTRAMEGMSIASQLEASDNSLILAKSARRDAEVMKLIAVLGMVFLPGMFTSSFFSIGFFEYREDKQLSVSQYIWIWASVTFLATVLTIALFQISATRRLQRVATNSGPGMV